MSVNKIRTEKQYLKAMKNYTDHMWERIQKEWEEEDTFRPGSEEDYKLFGGIKGHHPCPCGSNIKYRHCCQERVGILVDSLMRATYSGAEDTTKDRTNMPWGIRLSPKFEIDVEFEEKDERLIPGIIETHPTVVDHLYLISAKEIAVALSHTDYGRAMYTFMVKFDEGNGIPMKEAAKYKEPLNEEEREMFVRNMTFVPSYRTNMRKGTVRLISKNTFVLETTK